MLGKAHEGFRFEAHGPGPQVLNQFDALVREGEARRQERSKWGRRALFTFLFLLVGVPLLFFAFVFVFAVLGALFESALPDYEFLGLFSLLGVLAGTLFGLVVFMLFVWALVRRSRVRVRTLDGEKLAVTRQALSLLAGESKAELPLQAFVDFASVTSGNGLAGPRGATLFRQNWLVVTTRLLDGTRIKLVVATRVKLKTQRKPRYEKIKRKWVDLVELSLADRRPVELPPQASGQVQGRMGYAFPRVTKHRSGPRSMFLRFTTSPCEEISGRGSQVTGADQRISAMQLTSAVLRGYRAWAELRRVPTVPPGPGPGGPARGASGTAMMPAVPS